MTIEKPLRVLFATSCYNKDYQFLAAGGFANKVLLNGFPFTEKWLIVQDVPNEDAVARLFSTQADRVLKESEFADRALDYFELTRDDFKDEFGDGYKYSIASLITLYAAKDFDYVCFFCGDVELYKRSDWITKGLTVMNNDIVSARPMRPRYVLQDPNPQQYTQIFSDHCYLVPVKLFRDPKLYRIEPLVDRIHPPYGGKSFERRVTTFLQRENKYQEIIQPAEVIHPCY